MVTLKGGLEGYRIFEVGLTKKKGYVFQGEWGCSDTSSHNASATATISYNSLNPFHLLIIPTLTIVSLLFHDFCTPYLIIIICSTLSPMRQIKLISILHPSQLILQHPAPTRTPLLTTFV